MSDLPPVRSVDGVRVWRVKVAPGEKTCTRCGETTAESYCPRCAEQMHWTKARNLVPTVTYLRAGEYEVSR